MLLNPKTLSFSPSKVKQNKKKLNKKRAYVPMAILVKLLPRLFYLD
jgi:hypothetical protein